MGPDFKKKFFQEEKIKIVLFRLIQCLHSITVSPARRRLHRLQSIRQFAPVRALLLQTSIVTLYQGVVQKD